MDRKAKNLFVGVMNRASGYGQLLLNLINPETDDVAGCFVEDCYKDLPFVYDLGNEAFWENDKVLRLIAGRQYEGANVYENIIIVWDVYHAAQIAKRCRELSVLSQIFSVSTPDEYTSIKDILMYAKSLSGIFVFDQFSAIKLKRMGLPGVVLPIVLRRPRFRYSNRIKWRKKLEMRENQKLWLYIGRWQTRKNPNQIVGMIKGILENTRDKIYMHIDMAHENMGNIKVYDVLRKTVANNERERIIFGLSDEAFRNIKVYGAEYMDGLYSAADIVFNVSHREGIGLPILEGLFSGCIAVAPRFGPLFSIVNKYGLGRRMVWLDENRYNVQIYRDEGLLNKEWDLDKFWQEYESNEVFKNGRGESIGIKNKNARKILGAQMDFLGRQPHWREI